MVTYSKRQEALEFFGAFRDREKIQTIVDQIHEDLQKQKLPTDICPQFFKYKLEWLDKKVEDNSQVKTAYSKTAVSKTSTEKSIIAKVDEKKVLKKKPLEKNEEIKIVKEEKVEKVEEKKKVKRDSNAKELRIEVEKAKLKDELSYLNEQQKKVHSELEAERDRCKSREERINSLTEELSRVDQEKTRLQNSLLSEKKWRKEGEERIGKLQEELLHINQEEQGAELRLSTTNGDNNQKIK